jgi:hypothetical protein
VIINSLIRYIEGAMGDHWGYRRAFYQSVLAMAGGTLLILTMSGQARSEPPQDEALVVEVRPAMGRDIILSLEPAVFYDEPDEIDGPAYRQRAKDRNMALLLYGVTNNGVTEAANVQQPKTAYKSKNLKQFIDAHFEDIKKDYFNQDDPQAMRLVTGDPSFISESMTSGNVQKPAKLAGFTVPAGDWTIGGGYTWDEKNPLLMKAPQKGMMVGLRYDGLKIPIQVSYMTSGREIGGVDLGGGKYVYDNIMVGATIPVKERWFVNTTVQYRNDRNRMDSEQQQLIITFGTKFKF